MSFVCKVICAKWKVFRERRKDLKPCHADQRRAGRSSWTPGRSGELEVVFVDGKKGSLWRRESGVLIWARSIRDLKPEGL